MAGGADDCKAAGFLNLRGKLNISTTTCHVGGDGNFSALACLGDDFGLTGMLLSIKDIGLDAADGHHAGKEFGGFNVRGTHKHGTAGFGEFHHLVYDGVELGLLGLVDDVVLVVPYYRTVGGNHHHIQFVDVPELPCLRFCGTGHAGQLVVHAEVVLEGDGGKCLGGGLHFHVFLGLDCLVQAVGPAAAFHDTAGGFIYNLHLIVNYHIVNVLGEHCIGLKELDHSVYALALEGEVLHEGVLLFGLFLRAQGSVMSYFGNGRTHIREHEEVGVTHATGKGVVAFVGHVHGIEDFVDDKVQGVSDGRHLAFVVLHVVGLGFLHEGLHAGLGQELDERLILREALVAAVQKQAAVFLIAGRNKLLGLVESVVHKGALLVVEVFHIGPVLHELLISGSLFHRAGNDKGRTGVVDENGVNLIHNGIVVFPLDKVTHA